MAGYAVTAQYYDAMTAQHPAAMHGRMAEALAGFSTQGHPVIDIGAGTGLATFAVARALPDAEIFAIEPDPAMRPALMSRVWADEDLRRRVTILPMAVLDAPLPPVVSVAVASASLVHFDRHERQALWALLSNRLAENGRILVDIQCPVADDMAEMRIMTSRVGRMDYEAWAAAERLADERQRWRMTYVSRLDGVEMDRQSTSFDCWVFSGDQLLAEVAAHGLVGREDKGLVTLQRV